MLAQMVFTLEAKVFAAPDTADALETNWKHKVTPDQGDLINLNLNFKLSLDKNLVLYFHKSDLENDTNKFDIELMKSW